MIYDVIIIGAGPAGMTAAIYAGRSRLKTLVLEKAMPGGQAVISDNIENYPGFKDGISGADLMTKFMEQMMRLGAEYKTEEVIKFDFKSEIKVVETVSGNQYEAKSIIIATGAKPRNLNVPGEARFAGSGVSYCATCDGAFYKGKKVVVVGGGDSAIEEADYLTKFASEVVLVHRNNKFKANKLSLEKTKRNPRVRFITDTVVESINGEQKVEEVVLKNVFSGNEIVEKVDGVFIFIGYLPNTGIFEGHLEMDEYKYIATPNCLQTSYPGVFVAGDVRVKLLRQVATAVGDGAEALLCVEHYLQQMDLKGI